MFFWRCAFPGSGRVSLGLTGGDLLSVTKRSFVDPSQSIFEGGDSPNSGFMCLKKISQEIQVQDAYASITSVSGVIERLVHIFRSQRCIFPNTDLSFPQKIYLVCFPGNLLRISCISLWLTESDRAMFRGGDCPTTATRYCLGPIPGQRAAAGAVLLSEQW